MFSFNSIFSNYENYFKSCFLYYKKAKNHYPEWVTLGKNQPTTSEQTTAINLNNTKFVNEVSYIKVKIILLLILNVIF